jgi:Tol biopolymer transport system component
MKSIAALGFIALLAFPTCNGQSAITSLPIGLTVIPEYEGHQGGALDYAGMVSHLDSTPKFERMEFKDPPLSDKNKGTGFYGWLRDGRRAIILSLTDANHIDAYVIDRVSGKTLVALTESMHSYAGTGGPSFYNAGVSPVYSAQDEEKVAGFLFLASTGSPRLCYVGPDGKQPSCIYVGGHGCNISPDGKHVACEEEGFDGIRLYDLAIQSGVLMLLNPSNINRGDGETLALRYAVWAPNSQGFVYESRFSAHQGRIVYYELPSKLLPNGDYTILNTPDWIAGCFCESAGPYYQTGKTICKNIGTCDDLSKCNIGTELPAWSGDSKFVYYSAFRRIGPQPFTRVLGRVSLERPGYFEPLTEGFEHGGARSAAVSPDGKFVAFESVTTANDSRSQLYLLDLAKSTKVIQLTKLPLAGPPEKAEVYYSLWRPN